jgi:GNAT superfamily N-acetyltransferase
VPVLLGLIQELAAYERAPEAARLTEAQLSDALFGDHPAAEALIAGIGGVAQGFAVWFESFSTWTGRALYLEDLFIRPAARQLGLGRQILAHLAGLAVKRGYARMEWQALDWNEPAIRFYTGLGAEPLTEWTKFRLSGDALLSVASR